MRDNTLRKVKIIGIATAVISAIALVMLISATFPIALRGHLDCSQALNSTCTVIGHFPVETFVGSAGLVILMLLGIWTFARTREESNAVKTVEASKSRAARNLSGDEKAIYDFVVKNDGTAFQNDIVRSLGYSKVKASRLIDKLEAKNLVERRRRGMANLIVLKRD